MCEFRQLWPTQYGLAPFVNTLCFLIYFPAPFHVVSVVLKMDPAEEDYPTEIHDYLSAFETAVGSVDAVLKTMMSVSRSELLQKVRRG